MQKNLKVFFIVGAVIVVAGIIWAVMSTGSQPDYQNINSSRPVKGKADASVVVQEYSDFQCPACKAAEPLVSSIINTYGDRILFEYHHFPLTKLHAKAYSAALAAECANDQGKFWEYHDLLFANQPNFSDSELINYANDLGLDTTSFSACLKSRAKRDVVEADLQQATSLGLPGTPTFLVNGQQTNGAGLEAAIKGALGE